MKWVEFFQTNRKSKLRLFCFHHGGGGASTFYPWLKEMPEAVELATVQLPGRENRFREPLLDSIDAVIPLLLEDFKAYLDKPYVLFGHSLGGLISFELTRALRRQRLPLPHHLILSGTKAPHLPLNRKMLHNLPSDKLISELFIYNGVPKEILNGDKELMELFLPIIRADFKIRETYVYKEEAPLVCNITVLCGIEDLTVSMIETQQWKQYTLLNFKYFLIPGDHFFIKSAQKDVLDIIRQILKNNV